VSVTAIAFTMYPVSDMVRAQTFYQDVLGLKQAGLSSDAWVEFEIGGGTFGIGNFEQLGTPGTAQALALEVSDMPAFRARLADHGIELPEAHETPICFISGINDPDGNRITIHQAKHA
jgi:predicted enzyme related to lactoylglutathione lyase